MNCWIVDCRKSAGLMGSSRSCEWGTTARSEFGKCQSPTEAYLGRNGGDGQTATENDLPIFGLTPFALLMVWLKYLRKYNWSAIRFKLIIQFQDTFHPRRFGFCAKQAEAMSGTCQALRGTIDRAVTSVRVVRSARRSVERARKGGANEERKQYLRRFNQVPKQIPGSSSGRV